MCSFQFTRTKLPPTIGGLCLKLKEQALRMCNVKEVTKQMEDYTGYSRWMLLRENKEDRKKRNPLENYRKRQTSWRVK